MAFWIQLLIAFAMMVVAYLIVPKPKAQSPEIKDMDNPVAEAGKPLPVVFGTVTVKGLNVLWYGEKNYTTRKVK